MDPSVLLFIEQVLNGLMFGLMLFLITAGLTLVFGIMDLVNLAHGVLFMLGAFATAWFAGILGGVVLPILLATALVLIIGVAMEFTVLRHFYQRGHLDQVLVTFGFILIFNEVARYVWGAQGIAMALPPSLNQPIHLFGDLSYPLYRFGFILCGLAISVLLYFLIVYTRVGMIIRAGASDRDMLNGLGVNVRLLFTFVFGLGAALAGFAGGLAAPITSATIGMGEPVLIIAFVVIVLGGVGNVAGAFWAALLVGLFDTLGRTYSGSLLSALIGPGAASAVAPSISGMLVYLLMAVVLVFRPEGLFARRGG